MSNWGDLSVGLGMVLEEHGEACIQLSRSLICSLGCIAWTPEEHRAVRELRGVGYRLLALSTRVDGSLPGITWRDKDNILPKRRK